MQANSSLYVNIYVNLKFNNGDKIYWCIVIILNYVNKTGSMNK